MNAQSCTKFLKPGPALAPMMLAVWVAAGCFALGFSDSAYAQGGVQIDEVESDGVKGLKATFQVNQPREVVFSMLNDLEQFMKIFPNVLAFKVLSRKGNSLDVHYRIDAVLAEAEYTLRRKFLRKGGYDLISWNRLSGDANVIKGSWLLTDGKQSGTTNVVYQSYVDVSAVVPTSTVRSIAIGKVEDMVVRVRKACDVKAQTMQD